MRTRLYHSHAERRGTCSAGIRRLNRVAYAACAVALLGVFGCASTGELDEISAQRDRIKEALDKSIEQLEKERQTVKVTRAENTKIAQQLAAEQSKRRELEESLGKVEQDRTSADTRLQDVRKEYAKLKETHDKLGKMAQESLGELSELRQRNDSLAGEKKRLEERAALQSKQVAVLTKEVDDMRLELNRTREAIRVIQENGENKGIDPEVLRLTTENKRLEEVAAAQKEQVVALSRELVDLRSTITKSMEESVQKAALSKEVPSPITVIEQARALIEDRYSKALNGDVTWDVLTISVVSTAGGVFVFGLIWLLMCVRFWRTRRTLKQLQLYVDEITDDYGEESYDEGYEDDYEEDQVREAPPRRAPAPRSRGEARAEGVGDRTTRIAPTEFSPIMRSSGSSRAEKKPEKRPEPERSAPKPRQSAAPARPQPSSEDQARAASSRKIIGAWKDEAAPEPAAAKAKSAPSSASDSFAEDSGAQTQIISDFDLSMLEGGGNPLEPTLKPRKPAESKKSAARKPAAQAARPAPKSKGSGSGKQGSSEEQELLNELKSIINKKFDNVLNEE